MNNNTHTGRFEKTADEFSVERERDGVTEHKHGEYDYWHPAARVHSRNLVSTHRNVATTRTTWDIDEDGVDDIIEAMVGQQLYHVNLHGDYIDIPATDAFREIITHDTLSVEWVVALSKCNIETILTYRAGKLSECKISSPSGDARFHNGRVYFERGTPLHDAKLLLETGIAAMYIPYPDLADAMHILSVSGGGSHYDLVRLPNGGHVPTEILVRDYMHRSWEDLARIPLGKPRDAETFACPICGEKSFFAGTCHECKSCYGCDFNDDDDECASCAHGIELDAVSADRNKRKEYEHGEILRRIKSGNWKGCRYIRG